MKTKLTILFLSAILLLTACAGNAAAPDLRDTSWALVSYGPLDAPVPTAPDVTTRFDFGADGTLSGTAGCNHFSGGYEVDGDLLIVGPLMSTLMACEGPGMDQEDAVFALLQGTVSFVLGGDTLTIFSADGQSALRLARAK